MEETLTNLVANWAMDEQAAKAKTDAEALAQLYEKYYDAIYRFCVRRVFSPACAEDVTSMVFLNVARKIDTFTGTTQKQFRCWLYTIAANEANAYIRKHLRRRRLFEKAAEFLVEQQEPSVRHDHPPVRTIYRCLTRLKPDQQTVVTLRYLEGREYEEIAELMDLREVSVRVTLHRALKKLRKMLNKAEGDLA